MQGTKVVTVDLLARSRGKGLSPSRSRVERQGQERNAKDSHLDFSFSREKSNEKEEKSREKGGVARTLFGTERQGYGQRPKEKSGVITTVVKGKPKTNASRSRSKIYNFEESEEPRLSPSRMQSNNDRLFKKSVDKLKKSFLFHGVRNNKDLTIRTLKEIGKNAKKRKDNV